MPRCKKHKWDEEGKCKCGVLKKPVLEVVPEVVKKAKSIPVALPERALQAHKDTAIEDVIELVDKKGLSHAEAGKVLDISRQTVSYLCKQYGIEKGGVEKYRRKEVDLIDLAKSKHLYSLAKAQPKGDKPRDDALIYGILYDKGQLAAGKPTAHVLYADISRSQAQLKAELEAMGYKIEDLEDEDASD